KSFIRRHICSLLSSFIDWLCTLVICCSLRSRYCSYSIFSFNDTATTEIYTLSLHDALPICARRRCAVPRGRGCRAPGPRGGRGPDRKSTRLNSSHQIISYAVFCLKKKNKSNQRQNRTGFRRLTIPIC